MLTSEQLRYILDKQLNWIASADSRLALVLPLSAAMLGALSAYAPKANCWTLASGIPASFSIFFLCLSIIFCALASFPRTSGTKGSFIFFEGINSRDESQFNSDINSATESDFQVDLIKQCHINAQIASLKFMWVKRGIACLFSAMIPWAFSIYQFYGIKNGTL